MERQIVDRIFRNRMNEASFEVGGSRYASAFGRYTKDGESITRDDYFKAKSKMKSAEEKSISTPEDKSESQDFDMSTMSSTAGSKVRKGKEGPYYYDNGDLEAFEKSITEVTDKFVEKYPNAVTVKTSKNQTVVYDEETGYAIVTKRSPKSGNSWTQYKKLTDQDKSLIAKAGSEPPETPKIDSDQEDEELVQLAKSGDEDAQEKIITKYERLAHHLAKDLFMKGGERDDLVQEALMGLWSAIADYEPGHNKNFKQFAILAMKRNMQDAVRKADSWKNTPLNRSEDYETSLDMTPSSETPETIAIEKGDEKRLMQYIKDNLSEWQLKVLKYYLQGYSYDEIAEKTGKNKKSIGNAMNHVRSRLQVYKDTYKESALAEAMLISISEGASKILEVCQHINW